MRVILTTSTYQMDLYAYLNKKRLNASGHGVEIDLRSATLENEEGGGGYVSGFRENSTTV